MTTAPIGRSDRFGDIRPRRHRGGGGFSDVYEGVTTSGKRVALKVFRFKDNQSAKEIEKLARERKVLARINSRGVAKYYDSNFQNDPPWIASEYVDGPTLKEAIASNGLMNAQSTELLIHQISAALTEIHNENVAHRDLSPNNVILGPDGPVIIDFGSSRLTDSSQGLVSILTSGTPGYLSPEAQAGSDASTPADVFAIAKIAEFALTGESDLPRSEKLNQLSPSLARMLYQALEIDPSERPTAQQILDASQPNYESLKEISASNFPEIKLRKLPLRFRLRTVSIIAIAAAALGLLTVQLFREKPITTESLMEYLREQVPADSTTKYKTINRDGGAILSFDLPENFSQQRVRVSDTINPSFSQLDAIAINADFSGGTSTLEMKVSLQLNQDFGIDAIENKKQVQLTDPQMTVISDYLDTELAFRNQNFLPVGCNFVRPEYASINKLNGSIHAVAITKDCGTYDMDKVRHITSSIFYPNQHLMISINGVFDPSEINIARLIDSIKVSKTDLLLTRDEKIGDFIDLSGYQDQSGRLLLYDDEDQRFFWAKIAILLEKGEGFQIEFDDTEESVYSVWGITDFDDKAEIFYFPHGRIWTFEENGIRQFDNNSSKPLVLVFELDTLLGDRPNVKTRFVDAIQGIETIPSNRVDLEIGEYDPDSSYSDFDVEEFFGLPSDPNSDIDYETKKLTVGDVQIVAPKMWTELSVPKSSKSNSEALSALFSSGSEDIQNLERDIPQLRITPENLANIYSNYDGWTWIQYDDSNCSSQSTYNYESKDFYVVWIVNLGCQIRDSFDLRAIAGKSTEQAAPIFKILVTEKWTTQVQFPTPLLRIDFVPETIEDLDYLKEMILSLKPVN